MPRPIRFLTPARRRWFARRWTTYQNADLAEKLGVARSTVTYYARRLGLPRKPRPPGRRCCDLVRPPRGCCRACQERVRQWDRTRKRRARDRKRTAAGR